MSEKEYYEMVFNVQDELNAIDQNRLYRNEIDWNRVKRVYESMGVLRKECSETIEKQLAFSVLEVMERIVIKNIKRMLYDVGGIAYDD